MEKILLNNLPILLRGVCDIVLSGETLAMSIARALASIIDVVENVGGH